MNLYVLQSREIRLGPRKGNHYIRIRQVTTLTRSQCTLQYNHLGSNVSDQKKEVTTLIR